MIPVHTKNKKMYGLRTACVTTNGQTNMAQGVACQRQMRREHIDKDDMRTTAPRDVDLCQRWAESYDCWINSPFHLNNGGLDTCNDNNGRIYFCPKIAARTATKDMVTEGHQNESTKEKTPPSVIQRDDDLEIVWPQEILNYLHYPCSIFGLTASNPMGIDQSLQENQISASSR